MTNQITCPQHPQGKEAHNNKKLNLLQHSQDLSIHTMNAAKHQLKETLQLLQDHM
jgi:hypothetical protein